MQNNNLNLALEACKAAYEKKGENIILLNVSKLTVLADYFLIITGNSKPHIQALTNHIKETLEKLKIKVYSSEGLKDSSWAVLDFSNLIVHIMHEDERKYYKLESFWRNATIVNNKLWKKAS